MGWCRIVLACCLVGCAPSEEEIQAEFDEFVATRRACSVDDDCVLAATGCPLGCGTAVNRRHEGEVEAKARELIDDYESFGRACEYDCIASVAACIEGRCDEQPLQ